MKAMRTLFAGAVLALAVQGHAAAETATPPKRASGLWEVTPSIARLGWQICVESNKDKLIEDDLWSGFDKECTLLYQRTDGNAYSFEAICPDAVKFAGRFEGDFASAYRASSTTSFASNGKTVVQEAPVTARRIGDCPPEIPPGAKKLNVGFVLKGNYDER